MRADMEKVIVERPRWSSDWPNRKFHKSLPIGGEHEDEVKFAPSSRARQEVYRGSRDLLGPLRRFLRRNVGRPWDKVFSEIVEQVDDRRLTGYHLLTHVEWEVATKCFFGQDRKLYSGRNSVRRVHGFYVHPKTGLLGYVARESKRERDRQRLQSRSLTEIPINGARSYRLLEGLWYVVTHECIHVPRRSSGLPERWDVALKQRVRLKYGTNRIGITKRQCNRDELKVIRGRIAAWEYKLRHM